MTLPIKSVMVIVGFLGGLEIEVVGSVLIGYMAPGEVPAFSSLIVFCDFMAFGIIVIIFINTVENRCAQGVAVIIDPGMGIGNGVVLAIPCAAEFPVEVHLVAGAAEVGITQFHDTYGAVGVGVAGTYGNDTGLLFNHIDFDDYIMFIFFARQELHVHIFKVAQVVQSFHAAACLELIEGFAFLQLQLAGDNLILGLVIAYNDNIFHYAFRNIYVKGAVRRNIDRRNGNKHVALFQVEIFDLFQLLVHQHEVENAVLRDIHNGLQIVTGEYGISRKGNVMNHRIGCQLVGNAHPFRHGTESGRNLGEYTGGADRGHIVSYSLFRELGARSALYQGREFRFNFFRNAGKVNGCNRLSYLGFNGFIIGLGQVEGRIPHCHGLLLGLLHSHGRFRFAFRSFIGNLSCAAGLLSGLYIDHGALGHPTLAGCHIRRICKGSPSGKGQQNGGKKHNFSAF